MVLSALNCEVINVLVHRGCSESEYVKEGSVVGYFVSQVFEIECCVCRVWSFEENVTNRCHVSTVASGV